MQTESITYHLEMKTLTIMISLLLLLGAGARGQTEWSLFVAPAVEEMRSNTDSLFPLRLDLEVGLSARHTFADGKNFLFASVAANTRPWGYEPYGPDHFRYHQPYFCTELGYGRNLGKKMGIQLFGYNENPSDLLHLASRRKDANGGGAIPLAKLGVGAKASLGLGDTRLSLSLREELSLSYTWDEGRAKARMRNYSLSIEIPLGRHEE